MNKTEKGHIFIVANTTWYVYNFRCRLIAELLLSGYLVTVLSPADDFVKHLEKLGARHIHFDLVSDGTNPLRELSSVAKLIILLRHERPSILLTYTPKVNIYCSLAARLLELPVVVNVSGLGRAFSSGGLLRNVAIQLYKLAFQHPWKIFFQNNEDRTEFINHGLVRSERTERIPGSGVDLERFCSEKRETDNSKIKFLLVARLLWEKGVGEYVQAARVIKSKYKNVEFQLLGFLDVKNPSAVSRAEVEQWAQDGVITYLGSAEDVRPHYAAADCVVLPSFYREGVPRTLLEASSMGIPIITTDSVGCRDVVKDGKTGFLCRVKDANDLAEKIEHIIRMTPEERTAMGMAGRARMEREFDERIVIERYMDAVNEIYLHEKQGVKPA